MDPPYDKANKLSRAAIGAAIEVHRLKGPGLNESIDERCPMRKLELRPITAVNQRLVRIEYQSLVRVNDREQKETKTTKLGPDTQT
jgi:hypothetical protein